MQYSRLKVQSIPQSNISISCDVIHVRPGPAGRLYWPARKVSDFVCKYHVLSMTCINLPCKISIDVSLRTTAHSYIVGVPSPARLMLDLRS